MRWWVKPSVITGTFCPPGDKSIAHRGLLVGALARGESTVDHLPNGQDVLSTRECLQSLGVAISQRDSAVSIRSSGELMCPVADLYAGNSGTTTRLLAGILAGHDFPARLTGYESLSRRPMERVAAPLRQMGARVTTMDGRLPMDIRGGGIDAIRYELPVASAQVKSAVLLASLFARGTTTVVEPLTTRDHTERLLAATGVEVSRKQQMVSVAGGQRPSPFSLRVPGDLSSAAFLLAGGALTGGTVTARETGVNPTRTGILTVLADMGVGVSVANEREDMGEPVADVTVSGRIERPVQIAGEDVPGVVDELPLIALLATQAPGRSVVRGAGELRWKEVDRIAEVVHVLSALGADIQELPDGFVVHGPTRLHGAAISSGGDHRLAMMLAVAGCLAGGDTVVDQSEAADISFPRFTDALRAVGGVIDAA
jgi:3-phosphoshikimate 1-carboxyvinyltransferase